MAKRKIKSNTIVIEREMVRSPAYLSLSTGAAHIVLSTFFTKRKMQKVRLPGGKEMWECVNDGEIAYPYAEAQGQGLSAKRFRNAIDQLLNRGFIRITKTGKGKHRSRTLYGLSDGWKTWKPGESKGQRRKRKPTEAGFKPGNTAWQHRKSSTVDSARRSTVQKARRNGQKKSLLAKRTVVGPRNESKPSCKKDSVL